VGIVVKKSLILNQNILFLETALSYNVIFLETSMCQKESKVNSFCFMNITHYFFAVVAMVKNNSIASQF